MKNDDIWSETINEVYYCKVEQAGPDQGELMIIKDKAVLYRQKVEIDYGGVIGPDPDYTDAWHNICVDFIANVR